MSLIDQNSVNWIVNGEPHDASVYNRPTLNLLSQLNASPALSSLEGINLNDQADPASDILWSSLKTLEFLGYDVESGGIIGGGGSSNVITYTADKVEIGAITYFAHTRFSGALYGGTMNPTGTVRLNYDGNFHATTFIEPSDIRLKTDLEVIENAVDKLDTINGYTFTMKDTGERKTGLIAQEVSQVLPEAVTGTEEEGYGVAYGNVVGILVQAVKELSARVKELESK